MAYCEERELGVFSTCLTGGQANALLLTGRWNEAAEISAGMLRRPGISPVNRLNPLTVIGSIRGRRREPDAWDLLDKAIALAAGTGSRAGSSPSGRCARNCGTYPGSPASPLRKSRPSAPT
jgi:hypothetical protein